MDIKHIDQVRPYLNEFFYIAEKDYFDVVNYTTISAFSNDIDHGEKIRRECRGIKFYKDGTIAARPFAKFFNLGEKEEVFPHNVDLSQKHNLLAKLDGSMIHPILINENLRYCTKMGITNTAMHAEEFIAVHPQYNWFSLQAIINGYTPIFEWISPRDKIVVDYGGQEHLVLLAMRHTEKGFYYPYKYLQELGYEYNVPVVSEFEIKKDADIDFIAQYIRQLKDQEGIVIRFEDGHMIKIKTEEYVLFHKSKDNLQHEKNVIAVLINDSADDFKSFLVGNDLTRFETFQKKFDDGINNTVREIHSLWQTHKYLGKTDRKTFAVKFAPNLPPYYAHVIFHLWDRHEIKPHDVHQEIKNVIQRHCGSQTAIEKVVSLWGGSRWSYKLNEE